MTLFFAFVDGGRRRRLRVTLFYVTGFLLRTAKGISWRKTKTNAVAIVFSLLIGLPLLAFS